MNPHNMTAPEADETFDETLSATLLESSPPPRHLQDEIRAVAAQAGVPHAPAPRRRRSLLAFAAAACLIAALTLWVGPQSRLSPPATGVPTETGVALGGAAAPTAAEISAGVIGLFINAAHAQTTTPPDSGVPPGWGLWGRNASSYRAGTKPHDTDAGGRFAYVRSQPDAADLPPDSFGTLTQSIAADAYRGKRVQLTGQLRAIDAPKGVNLWMRVDSAAHMGVAFDNMEGREPRGTTGWTPANIVLEVPPTATAISYGFFVSAHGEANADSLTFRVVDRSVPTTDQRPDHPRAPSNLGFDQPR